MGVILLNPWRSSIPGPISTRKTTSLTHTLSLSLLLAPLPQLELPSYFKDGIARKSMLSKNLTTLSNIILVIHA